MDNYVNALAKFGNVVTITKSAWVGGVSLKPEDLGLTEIPENFNLGSMKLIPKGALSKFTFLASEATRSLEYISFKLPFPGSRFVPNSNLPDFKKSMENTRIKFCMAINEFKKNYLRNKLMMRQYFVDASFKAYDLTKKEINKTTFVNDFLERVEKHYPKLNDVESKFKISYDVYGIVSPILDDKVLQGVYEKELSSKIEKSIEDMIYEIRSRVSGPIQRIVRLLDEGKNLKTASTDLIKKSIKSFEVLNTLVDDIPTQQSLNRLKTEVLSKSVKKILEDTELRENFRIRLEDILKIVSHPKSHEIAIQELKKRILGKK